MGSHATPDVNMDSQTSPEGVCHFFRLPGELRNRVYEYYLSEPKGLLYREDQKGMGRLYLMDSDEIAPPEEEPQQVKATGENEEEGSDKAQQSQRSAESNEAKKTEQTAQSDKVEQSTRFREQEGTEGRLKRPRSPDRDDAHEQLWSKRAKIDNGKMYTLAESIKQDKETSYPRDANQLRFVNRKLYEETRGLGLQNNDLTFRESVPESFDSVNQFNKLLKSCSVTQKERIRSATLERCSLAHASDLHQFCIDHSRATVNMHVRELVQSSQVFIIQALVLSCVLKGDSSLIKKIAGRDTTLEQDVRAFMSKSNRTAPTAAFPSNLRFFPLEPVFDHETIRKNFENPFIFTILESQAKGDKDAWIAAAKDVCENGI